MDFAECISDQLAAAGRPLVGVTLAAVPCPDTPLILTLHWHGFVEERIAPVETAKPVRFSSVPSSALQLNMRWDELMSSSARCASQRNPGVSPGIWRIATRRVRRATGGTGDARCR
jgi:hypothetical protein